MTTPAIDIHGLAKHYGTVKAVDDVTFQVRQGTIFGFMGHNGAGKTTTIRMLLGLARPTTGTATVLGHDILADSLAIRRVAGFLPGTFSLPADMTPTTFLHYIGTMFALPAATITQRTHHLLQLMDLTDAADRPLRQCSTGMQQKVALAQALINEPRILFLDEPTSGLDPLGRHDILQYIRSLSRDQGVTVLFSTHILSDVESSCEDVAILHQGRLLAAGPLDHLKQQHHQHNMDDLYLQLVRDAA